VITNDGHATEIPFAHAGMKNRDLLHHVNTCLPSYEVQMRHACLIFPGGINEA